VSITVLLQYSIQLIWLYYSISQHGIGLRSKQHQIAECWSSTTYYRDNLKEHTILRKTVK